MHFLRLAVSTGRQQSQVLLLVAVPQLSRVDVMSHFSLVTRPRHLQNSHTSWGPVAGLGDEGGVLCFFPFAESFEITGRKFCKPVLLFF